MGNIFFGFFESYPYKKAFKSNQTNKNLLYSLTHHTGVCISFYKSKPNQAYEV